VIIAAFQLHRFLALIWSEIKYRFIRVAVRFDLYRVWISIVTEWDSGRRLAETEKKIWDLKDKVKRAQHERLRRENMKKDLGLEDDSVLLHGSEDA